MGIDYKDLSKKELIKRLKTAEIFVHDYAEKAGDMTKAYDAMTDAFDGKLAYKEKYKAEKVERDYFEAAASRIVIENDKLTIQLEGIKSAYKAMGASGMLNTETLHLQETDVQFAPPDCSVAGKDLTVVKLMYTSQDGTYSITVNKKVFTLDKPADIIYVPYI